MKGFGPKVLQSRPWRDLRAWSYFYRFRTPRVSLKIATLRAYPVVIEVREEISIWRCSLVESIHRRMSVRTMRQPHAGVDQAVRQRDSDSRRDGLP